MVTPAWRYRIQRRSWLAAVPAVDAKDSRGTGCLGRGTFGSVTAQGEGRDWQILKDFAFF